MHRRIFPAHELKLSTWQYTIKFTFPYDFHIGQSVFLRSNPNVPLIVDSIDKEFVICKLKSNSNDELIFCKPQIILPYEFANLMTSSCKRFNVNLN